MCTSDTKIRFIIKIQYKHLSTPRLSNASISIEFNSHAGICRNTSLLHESITKLGHPDRECQRCIGRKDLKAETREAEETSPGLVPW